MFVNILMIYVRAQTNPFWFYFSITLNIYCPQYILPPLASVLSCDWLVSPVPHKDADTLDNLMLVLDLPFTDILLLCVKIELLHENIFLSGAWFGSPSIFTRVIFLAGVLFSFDIFRFIVPPGELFTSDDQGTSSQRLPSQSSCHPAYSLLFFCTSL